MLSTTVKAGVVAKPGTLGISPLTSLILALRAVVVAKLVIPVILSLISLTFAL